MKRAIFTFLSILLSSLVFANNIQLQKVSLTDTNRTAKTVNIKMNISWEHSWRDSINWDAAWIIVKYKEPKDSMWKWKHAMLAQAGNNTGTETDVKIVVPDDRTGAFFYRSAIGEGNIASDDVKLFWDYGAAGVTNIDSVEVRVFATEMVYVPQGNYCLGDGNGTTRSENSFQLKNAPNNYAVISDKWSPLINTSSGNVGDDAIVNTEGIRISGLNGLDVNNDKVADFPNFPTGYQSFYCMKYKVTQGQYTDFLNTISVNDTTASLIQNYKLTSDSNFLKNIPKPLQAAWGTLGDFIYMFIYPADKRRHTIVFDSVQLKFIVNRPDRAYGLMNLNKGLSFSEWFGLRPMSELEFEKACRGPLVPMYHEEAWGHDSEFPIGNGFDQLTYSGIENGTEYFSDYNITNRYLDPVKRNVPGSPLPGAEGGDGGIGPYRVGIFATDTSSRISSGASYYGIMDLSKITSEIVFPISTAQYRLLSYSMNGKGILSAFGSSYNFPKGQDAETTSYRYGITSFRGNSNDYNGFRAVRIAPSDN